MAIFKIVGAPSTYLCLLFSATYGVEYHEFSRHSTGREQLLTVRSKVLRLMSVSSQFVSKVDQQEFSSGQRLRRWRNQGETVPRCMHPVDVIFYFLFVMSSRFLPAKSSEYQRDDTWIRSRSTYLRISFHFTDFRDLI